MHRTISQGRKGENIANDFLSGKGYKTLSKNYFSHGGELDIVMQQGEMIVFVEVKSIQQSSLFSIYGSLTKSKKRSLLKAANQWLLANNRHKWPYRFDFVGVIFNKTEVEDIIHEQFLDMKS